MNIIPPPLSREICSLLNNKEREVAPGIMATYYNASDDSVRPALFSIVREKSDIWHRHYQIILAPTPEYRMGGFHYDGDSVVVQFTTLYPTQVGDEFRPLTQASLLLSIFQEKRNGIDLPQEYRLLEHTALNVQCMTPQTIKTLLDYLVSYEALQHVKGNEAYKSSLTPEILDSINRGGMVHVKPTEGFFGLYHEREAYAAESTRIYRAEEYLAAVPTSKLSKDEINERIALFNSWRAVITGDNPDNVLENVHKFANMVDACPVEIAEAEGLSDAAKALAGKHTINASDPAELDAWMELVDFCWRELESHEYVFQTTPEGVYTVDSLTWSVGTSINACPLSMWCK